MLLVQLLNVSIKYTLRKLYAFQTSRENSTSKVANYNWPWGGENDNIRAKYTELLSPVHSLFGLYTVCAIYRELYSNIVTPFTA